MAKPRRLPGTALVIRGGSMEDPEELRKNARNHQDRYKGEWAISVAAIPGAGLRGLCRAAKRPNGRVCVSTVQLLRAGGYGLRRDWDRADGHTDLILPHEPTDDDLAWLTHLFSRSVRNAGRARK